MRRITRFSKHVCTAAISLSVLLAAPVVTNAATESTSATPQEVEVVVTASRMPQELDTAPVWVDVINQDEIAESGAETVTEVLDQLPGVTVKTNGTLGSVAGISMRGSTNEQVLILVDGRRINSPMSGSLDLNQIPMAMVERVEVLQGSASALYGADAMGGVVNIITKGGDALKSEVYSEISGHGTVVLQGVTQGGEGSLRYFVSGENMKSDGYRPNSDYNTTKIFARIDNQWSSRDLTQISLTHYRGKLGVPGPISFPNTVARQADAQTRADISYERTVSADANLNLRAYWDNGNMSYDDGFSQSKHDVSVVGVEAQMNQPAVGNRLMLTYGGNAESTTAVSTDLGTTRQRQSVSAFGHSQLQLTPQADASIGIRYDQYSTHGGALSGRAGVAYRPLPETRLYSFVGTSFRAPTFNELYWEDAWSKGNPQLRPETANNYEVGINSSMGHSANLALAYFIRDTKNLIGWRPQDASNPYGIWEVANTAAALVKGVESTWSQQLGSHLTWQMGYTVLDARNQNGAKLDQVAPQQGNLNLTYQNLGFTARLDVKTKLDAPLLPGFTVGDLTVEQALLPGVKCTFQVRNLLNEQYAEQIGYPAAPRTYGFGARITF